MELLFEEIFEAGLLDLKMIFFSGKNLLIGACNDGKIRIYSLITEEIKDFECKLTLEIPFEKGTKCLFVDTKINEYFFIYSHFYNYILIFRDSLWLLCSCETNFVSLLQLSSNLGYF